MDLADRLIAQNKKIEATKPPSIDELGIPAPRDEDRIHFLNYLTARAVVRNPHLYSRVIGGHKRLFNGHEIMQSSVEDISVLCDWWKPLRLQERLYIYNKLLQVASVFDPTKICITGNLMWDLTTGELTTGKDIRTVA